MSKRQVIIKKTYITNYYKTYNGPVDKRVDNRVTNNHNTTYVVRTKPLGEEPRQWVDEKSGLPRSNVANVSWHKARKTWLVDAVDAQTRKLAHVGYAKKWDDAVRLREEAQKTEGTKGPGELEFREDGEAVVACGNCRHTFGLASYAPEPCAWKKKFADFEKACKGLESADPEAAEALLAVMPTGTGNKALRASQCRVCRDALHRSNTEGPNSARSICLATNREIHADMALRGCRDCGESRSECLECEHIERKGKPEGCHSILDSRWFADKYKELGPDEMWKAYRDPHVVVLCKCCHFRQPTHDAAMAADSSTLEQGSDKKRRRECAEANGAYNNKRKREFVNVKDGVELPPGQCYHCEGEYVCTEGFEISCHWMHRVDELKQKNVSKLANSPLCFATAKKRIDAEIDGTNGSGGCNLGCANCHFCCETLPRRKEGKAAWDKLMAEPIRKRV